MLPGMSIANFDKVNIFARLSVDEQAPLTSGDWQGQMNSVPTTAQDLIEIVIDKETP